MGYLQKKTTSDYNTKQTKIYSNSIGKFDTSNTTSEKTSGRSLIEDFDAKTLMGTDIPTVDINTITEKELPTVDVNTSPAEEEIYNEDYSTQYSPQQKTSSKKKATTNSNKTILLVIALMAVAVFLFLPRKKGK